LLFVEHLLELSDFKSRFFVLKGIQVGDLELKLSPVELVVEFSLNLEDLERAVPRINADENRGEKRI
jgi:hypothetical protein